MSQGHNLPRRQPKLQDDDIPKPRSRSTSIPWLRLEAVLDLYTPNWYLL